MDDREMARLRQEINPRAIIDLRTPRDPEKDAQVIRLKESGARYHPASNMGEIYLYRISEQPFGQRLVDALEIIAERDSHPLVFHCSAGKDRTGVLAAIVLTAIGIVDDDVVEDYALSAPVMNEIRARMRSDPETAQGVKDLPDFQWEASAESMTVFLSLLRREFGSADGYLKASGASSSLVGRLKTALLIQ